MITFWTLEVHDRQIQAIIRNSMHIVTAPLTARLKTASGQQSVMLADQMNRNGECTSRCSKPIDCWNRYACHDRHGKGQVALSESKSKQKKKEPFQECHPQDERKLAEDDRKRKEMVVYIIIQRWKPLSRIDINIDIR